jgi:hypothetical protein
MKGKLPNYLQTWLKGCGITCEIDTTNFINVKNHFNFFEIYFHFSRHNYIYYLCTKVFQSTMMYIKII